MNVRQQRFFLAIYSATILLTLACAPKNPAAQDSNITVVEGDILTFKNSSESLGSTESSPTKTKEGLNRLVHEESFTQPTQLCVGKICVDKRWPNAEVPYVIDDQLKDEHKNNILIAIDQINATVPIKWRAKNDNDKDFVHFKYAGNGYSCNSFVGRAGGEQPIRMTRSGCGVRILMHEMGHAMGLFHEHNRCDRDQYITIIDENLSSAGRPSFRKDCGRVAQRGSYDFNSIMHYADKVFSKNGLPVFVRADGTPDGIGERMTYSPGDIFALKDLYQLP